MLKTVYLNTQIEQIHVKIIVNKLIITATIELKTTTFHLK